MISRAQIREYAFMFLYEISIQTDQVSSQRSMFLEKFPLAQDELAFFDRLVEGVSLHQPELDKRIEPYLVNWTLGRLPKVDLTILRLAVFELLFMDDVPDNVAISEAVILSKKYSDDDSRSYINAVLGNLYRKEIKDQTQQID